MSVVVRPLRESDLAEADRIFRLAFGTFIGMPDPSRFWADAECVRARFAQDPGAAFAAELDGKLIGSNFNARWGTVGFFGPLTVDPAYWNKGVAQKLLEETVRLFKKWKLTHAGLFTFAASPKHVGLYQKFGFHPRFLTPGFEKPVSPPSKAPKFALFSASDGEAALRSCRALANRLYRGLDLSIEIRSVASRKLGDTVLLGGDAFAICHCGAGSEAGTGTCYVKFGAAKDRRSFLKLLDAVHSFAASRGLTKIMFGVNAAREEAYREVIRLGYRAERIQGVIMERGGKPGYNRPGVFVMDDWR